MIAPDKEVVEALYRLRGDNNFKRIIKWVQDSYEEQSFRNNREPDDKKNIMMRGGNIELEEILEHYKYAEDNFKRMNEPKKGLV